MKNIFFFLLISFSLQAAAQTSTTVMEEEVIYGHKDGLAMTMAKINPTGKDKHRAIISLVSGNWNSRIDMLSRYANASKIYAENGYTVFMVMHGSQPRFSIDEQVQDVKRAIRYVRFHSVALGVDSMKIGITGSSSGGNLSLLAALTDDTKVKKMEDAADKVSSRVQAAAVFYPPTDFLNWGASNTEMNRTLLKLSGVIGAFDFKKLSDSTGLYEHITSEAEVKQYATMLSPINNVSSDDPPVLLAHGTADMVVPLQQSESLLKKLKENNIPSDLIIKPGGGHGWADSDVEKKLFVQWFDKYLL